MIDIYRETPDVENPVITIRYDSVKTIFDSIFCNESVKSMFDSLSVEEIERHGKIKKGVKK